MSKGSTGQTGFSTPSCGGRPALAGAVAEASGAYEWVAAHRRELGAFLR
ncbi:hypothetical protein NRF20_40220 [Streptomyces sp. R-74717]